ncbi:MAG: carboxypeptidase M32 [Spirochaetes bacterium]|nr:carboxypeptidase M32 [Spirochaetota bacterium]
MEKNYLGLLEKVNRIHDLEKTAAVLMWDKETYMPEKGLQTRIDQLTTLDQLRHELYTSDEFGEYLEKAAAEVKDFPYNSNEASLIRFIRRDYADEKKLTADFVKRRSEVSSNARQAWVKAREENDFSHFQPWLEKVVELCQELAELYGYKDNPYDPLLGKFEFSMTTADVKDIFDNLKAELVPIREAIEKNKDKVDDSLVHQNFPIEKQKEFARYITSSIGYDYTKGRLDTVVHPFCTNFSQYDVRITTRWYADFLNPALFGALHESGHGLYEQGTHPDLYRTPLARGTSLGVHESQSRMIENIVGRSLGFWKKHFPKLQTQFPQALEKATVEEFYQGINKVQPSFIRVEADELTYNFHIILRFELEQEMLSGKLAARDLPAAWNEKMQNLLGITPPTDTEGCLQDVHWTRPGFGYFPTYALGNLYAAQFYEAAISQHPNITTDLESGNTTSLVAWLKENIHQHGRKFTPVEIAEKATGQKLSHEAFIKYIKTKYGKLYNF